MVPDQCFQTSGPTAARLGRNQDPGAARPTSRRAAGTLPLIHGTFAPRLDPAGNSVKGQLAAAFLSHQLGLDLFVSAP